MSTTRPFVTVHCDGCGATLPTSRTTPAGARGDADRQGWATSRYGDGYRGNTYPSIRGVAGERGRLDAEAEFDRWLAARDAEVAAKALRDAADAVKDAINKVVSALNKDNFDNLMDYAVSIQPLNQ